VLAVRDVIQGFKDAGRGQLIMACGTGKTLTSLWIKEKLKAQQVLVLVPSLSLLSQTLREWTAAAKTPFSWICVCSDATVAQQDRTQDDWFSHVSDIGVPVTGDAKEIRSFLRGRGAKVVFSTYQSSPLIADAQKDRKTPAFDIVFADEAHRCAGNVSEAFGCVLNAKKIRSDRLLFMTATPRILSKQIKTAAEGQDIEVASMDDHAVFGKVLHQLKFSQAIEQGLLSDYRVLVVGVDDAMVQKRIRDRDLLRTSNGVELDAETLATHVAIAKAVKDYDLRRVISFHGRVKGAQAFAADHMDVLAWVRKQDRPSGKTFTDYVSGDMNSGERNTKINRLRHLGADERGILANARCLSEGVDVPSLDGIAFVDPRKSQVDIVQAVGRAIRKSAGKTHGTIVIPVFIDTEENEQEALESSRFKPIWDVVNALRSHDDVLAQELDQLRISLGERNPSGKTIGGLERIVFDLPVMCEQSFADGLRTVLVEHTSASWMFWFGLLKDYCKRSGAARPSADYRTAHGFALGSWASNQRAQRAILPISRIALLESLPGWSWELRKDKWNEGFERLSAFAAKTGTATPSPKLKLRDGFPLGSWVGTQRVFRENLSLERIARLESLNGWSWDPFADAWSEGFSRLKTFTAANGSASPSGNYRTSDGYTLGVWVSNQRTKRKRLSAQRVAALESLSGWRWDVLTDQWRNGFDRLQDYIAKAGNARPPQGYLATDGFRLGQWVAVQRTKKDRLSKERTALLESLKGWSWDVLTDNWNSAFQQLKKYIAVTGLARPPQLFKSQDGFNLGTWVANQRSSRDSLTTERVELLESLNGWSWNLAVDEWNEGFNRLRVFASKNASATPRVDYRAKDGYPLGSWARLQRNNKSRLTSERVAALESLVGWSWDPYADQWQTGFDALKEYVALTGHARPPYGYKAVDGFRLGQWVASQRASETEIRPERIALLESLSGWTWNRLEHKWNNGFEKLRAFTAETGNARPGTAFRSPDGFPLGSWVGTQRTTRASLSPERIALLESLSGWTWNRLDEKWDNGFQKLKAFAEQTGSARISQHHRTADGFALGAWIHKQRSHGDSLPLERQRLLESLPGWRWDPHTDQWHDAYKVLKDYVGLTGHARPPYGYTSASGFRLGGWAYTQRASRTSLSKERKDLLASLKGWTWEIKSSAKSKRK